MGAVEGPETWQRGDHVADREREAGDPRLFVDQRGGVVAGLNDEAAELDDDALVLRARELAGVISTAEASLAVVVAEIERRELPSQWECRTVERFAGWHLEASPARARQLADVGRAMAAWPTLAEAVSDGTLSFDKAVIVARSADDASEEALVDLATRSTVAQAQRLCSAWRRQRATDPDLADPNAPSSETADDVERRPTLVVVRDDDGVELRARFDHVDGAVVLASLEAATDQVRSERLEAAPARAKDERLLTSRPADTDDVPRERMSTDQWRGLGLLRMAEASLDEVPERSQRNGFDTQVVVHLGVDTLFDPPDRETTSAPTDDSDVGTGPPMRPTTSGTPAGASTDGSDVDTALPVAMIPPERPRGRQGLPDDEGPARGRAPSARAPAPRLGSDDVLDRLAVGGPRGGGVLEPSGTYLRREQARMLACDAGLLTVLEDDAGDPLHIGPSQRTISRAARRAMVARDRTCTWPGCTATRVYAHHRQHRADGGHDDVENVCALCWIHHKLVHELDIRVEGAGGDGSPGRPRFRFFRPDGSEITASAGTPGADGRPVPPPPGEAEQALFERHVASGADPFQPSRWCRWEGDPLQLGEAVAVLYARRDRALRRTRPS